MKKSPVILCILATACLFALKTNTQQNFQGKAYYQTKTSFNMDDWVRGRELSPEQRKQIENRMKNFLEKVYILTFNKEASLYKEEEKVDAMNTGRGFGGFSSSFTAGPQYKNVLLKEIIQDQEFFGKQFLISDVLKHLEWKLGTETKQIGNYTCFKATATKVVDEFDWRSMRRRRTDDNEKKADSVKQDSIKTKLNDEDPLSQVETPKTIEVVAWYTPQIPINQGPGEYWGLPGLILEINADRTTILCTKIVLNPEEKEEIKKPTKGTVVTQKEYNDIVTKKMKELREMYSGRRSGRRW